MGCSSTSREAAPVQAIVKVSTGINGLDDVLLGGLPQGRTTLVTGGPGTGKTLLGLEFLYRGALAGEPGLFVTFEESADAVRRNAQAIGWQLQPLEEDGRLLVMHAELPSELLLNGEFELDGLLAILGGQVQALGARRIVVDALDVLLRIFRDPLRRQNQLYALHGWLLEQGLTVILTAKHGESEAAVKHVLDYLADCVLVLDQRVRGQVATRRLRVLKYRGSGFLSNEYPYIISESGIELMPVSTAKLQQQPLGPPVSTGNRELDAISGGFRKASCVLLAGSTGSGKTTLACQFAAAAAERGERILYVSFEESEAALVSSMLSPGIDLRPAVAADRLKIVTTMPESMGVEHHLLRLFQSIDTFEPDHLIMDAISACHRMGSERAAFDFLVRLINRCKEKGITCIFTNQSGSSTPIDAISGIGISSLVDTILRLEQTWLQGTYERRLLIIKSRGSKHSHEFHTFTISDHGVDVATGGSGSRSPGSGEA